MQQYDKNKLIQKLYGLLILIALSLIAFWFKKYEATPFNLNFFLTALLVGFIAQMIDGAIGMAYGVTASTFLMASGASPATASAATHLAEAFTTAASGLSHWKKDNIDVRLFKSLLIPGIFGAIVGVLFLTYFDGKLIRPFVSAYLLVLGVYIFIRAFKKISFKLQNDKAIPPLGFFGAFVDSVGGGGWGPVVTTTLVSSGRDPRTTIGSVSSAEFFVTLTSGFSFILFLGIPHWEATAGLIVGGLIAAPFAATLTSKFSQKTLLILVGIVIMTVSSYNLYLSLR